MNALRPSSLDEFVGQPQARRILQVLIAAARKRGEPVPHLLMSSGPGLGKTTLGRLVAGEMGGRLVEVVGSAIKTPAEMTDRLTGLKEMDVLFVDEVHALARPVEEQLYSAMEDNVVAASQKGYDRLMKEIGLRGGGEPAKTLQRLPPFTLIAATTLLGLVSAPLRSRFVQIVELEPYSVEDLAQIVSAAAGKMEFALPDQVAHGIAARSRGTARVAIGHLKWYRDYVMADGGVATMEALEAAFLLKGVDAHGMTKADRQYLRCLAESGEPVGLETAAATVNDSRETIEASLEPFLLRQGLVQRTPRGRVITPRGREVLAEVMP